MCSLLSTRIRKRSRPPCGLSGTLDRLENTWRREARYRLLLLSIILALCLLSGNWFSFSHLYPLGFKPDNPQNQSTGVAGLTCLLLAVLRIWPEVRRCRPRIAELQNAANQIQCFADRLALGLEVPTQEWQKVFEASNKLLGASGRMQDDESIHPILELVSRFFHLGVGKNEAKATAPSPTFIGFSAVNSQPESENADAPPPLRRPA